MKNKIKFLIIFLILGSLTGCKIDEKNEENYKDFLETRLKKEIIIVSDIEYENEDSHITHQMKVYEKENPDLVFETCTGWYHSTSTGTSYDSADNYSMTLYHSEVTEFYNNNTYGRLLTTEKDYNTHIENCHLTRYEHTLELKSLDNLNNLAEYLANAYEIINAYTYGPFDVYESGTWYRPLGINNVKYQDKVVDLEDVNTYDEILLKLNELKY